MDIVLDHPESDGRTTFAPGQKVSGRVTHGTDEKLDVKSVDIVLEGHGDYMVDSNSNLAYGQFGGAGSTSSGIVKYPLFPEHETFYQGPLMDSEQNDSWPFEFTLPTTVSGGGDPLPPSFSQSFDKTSKHDGFSISVRYRLNATIRYSSKFRPAKHTGYTIKVRHAKGHPTVDVNTELRVPTPLTVRVAHKSGLDKVKAVFHRHASEASADDIQGEILLPSQLYFGQKAKASLRIDNVGSESSCSGTLFLRTVQMTLRRDIRSYYDEHLLLQRGNVVEIQPNAIINSGGNDLTIVSDLSLDNFGAPDISDLPDFECHKLYFINHHNIKVELTLEQTYDGNRKIVELECECPVIVLP